MATDKDNATSVTYRNIMEEVIVRIHGIDAILRTPTTIRPAFTRESCFLQLRLICELIALGCLVCHGDIPATKTKALQKAWKPADILDRIQELHNDFYPVPVIMTRTSGGLHLEEQKKPHLTKSELISLWSKSGDMLHKGNLRRFLKQKDTTPPRFDDIIEYNQKALNLIESHKISRIGNDLHFITIISHEFGLTETKVNITVAIAETPT